MAQFADYAVRGTPTPTNKLLIPRVSRSGLVESIDQHNAGTITDDLFDIKMVFPYLLKADSDILKTFYDTNKVLKVQTRAMSDGKTYQGFMLNAPKLTVRNSERFDVTIELRGCTRD